MKISEVRTYIAAGLTDAQIAAIAKESKHDAGAGASAGAAGASAGAGASASGGAGAGTGAADFSAVVAAIKDLKETIQASNLEKAKNNDPETVDEILESLIIDD